MDLLKCLVRSRVLIFYCFYYYMSELVGECVCICGFVSHPQTTRSEEFEKCDVTTGYVLKRMLLLNIVEKLIAGSCTVC